MTQAHEELIAILKATRWPMEWTQHDAERFRELVDKRRNEPDAVALKGLV